MTFMIKKKMGEILMDFLQCFNNQFTTSLQLVSHMIKIFTDSIKKFMVFEDSLILWTYFGKCNVMLFIVYIFIFYFTIKKHSNLG